MAEDYTTINTLLDGGKLPLPPLPELRMFVVRREDPRYIGQVYQDQRVLEEIFVNAHFAEYGQGGVLILMTWAIDEVLGEPVTRTVRAFSSWIDVEVVPTPARSSLAH